MSRALALVLTVLACVPAACSRAPQAVVDDTASTEADALLPTPSAIAESSPSGPGAGPTGGAATPFTLSRKLRVVGTEPFWSAQIDGGALVYATPEFPGGARISVTRRAGAGFVEFSGTLDGKPITLRVAPGPCSDGMSDEVYPFTAVREIGPDIERGCARSGR